MPVGPGTVSNGSSHPSSSSSELEHKTVILPVEDPSEYRPEFQGELPLHLGKKKDEFRVYTEVASIAEMLTRSGGRMYKFGRLWCGNACSLTSVIQKTARQIIVYEMIFPAFLLNFLWRPRAPLQVCVRCVFGDRWSGIISRQLIVLRTTQNITRMKFDKLLAKGEYLLP